MSAAVSLLLAFLLPIQGTAPLRKSDLVRLLSGSAMLPGELAQLVRRNCLTFLPTDRDRSDFERLGADRYLLGAVSDCARRTTVQRTAPSAPPVAAVRAAAVADARIVRVVRVAQDSISGTVALKPDQPGTTSLAVIANGMRQYLTVTVPPRAAPGKVDCP